MELRGRADAPPREHDDPATTGRTEERPVASTASPETPTATPRNVLVTGGNRGIGLSIARAFVEAGDDVVITYRSGEPPEGLRGVVCEVTDTASVDRAFTEAEQILGGPVEVLVANAGITRDTLLMRMSD